MKYEALRSYVRKKCRGFEVSYTESEQSLVSKFSPDDETMVFDDPPAQEQSSLGQTMATTAGCNSSMVPESEQSPASQLLLTPVENEEPANACHDTSVNDIQEMFQLEEHLSQQKSEPVLAQSFQGLEQQPPQRPYPKPTPVVFEELIQAQASHALQ